MAGSGKLIIRDKKLVTDYRGQGHERCAGKRANGGDAGHPTFSNDESQSYSILRTCMLFAVISATVRGRQSEIVREYDCRVHKSKAAACDDDGAVVKESAEDLAGARAACQRRGRSQSVLLPPLLGNIASLVGQSPETRNPFPSGAFLHCEPTHSLHFLINILPLHYIDNKHLHPGQHAPLPHQHHPHHVAHGFLVISDQHGMCSKSPETLHTL